MAAQTPALGPPSAPKWQSGFCMQEDLIFGIEVGLTVLGVALERAQLLMAAAAVAGTGAVLDVRDIFSDPSNFFGVIGAVADLTWLLLTAFLIPFENNLWTDLELTASAATLLTPPGALAKAVVVGGAIALGLIGLEAEGCGIPL